MSEMTQAAEYAQVKQPYVLGKTAPTWLIWLGGALVAAIVFGAYALFLYVEWYVATVVGLVFLPAEWMVSGVSMLLLMATILGTVYLLQTAGAEWHEFCQQDAADHMDDSCYGGHQDY